MDSLEFIVRIEDLDQYRVKAAPQTAQRQLEDLATLGLDWDSRVIRQSERFDIYRDAASKLDAYECFCSRKEIAQASQAPHGSYRPYPGTCAELSERERARLRDVRKPAIRVRAGGVSFSVCDRLSGVVTRVVDDFVLIRNDGIPAYNLAVVVDDGLQGVTQVTRGFDLLDSAPRQAWLATMLGFDVAHYIHVGLVFNESGERLAKRDGAVTLRDLERNGVSARDTFHVLTDSLGFARTDSPHALLDALRSTAFMLDFSKIVSPFRFS
jgi:glutamyl-tRNA synthetase